MAVGIASNFGIGNFETSCAEVIFEGFSSSKSVTSLTVIKKTLFFVSACYQKALFNWSFISLSNLCNCFLLRGRLFWDQQRDCFPLPTTTNFLYCTKASKCDLMLANMLMLQG